MTIIPCEHDVLCGRSKYSYHHTGNQTFRKVIADNLAAYKSAPAKKFKMQIVMAIVDNVTSRGGRFLMQNSQGRWKNGDKTLAKKKAGNALRDAQRGRIKLATNISNKDNAKSAAHLPNSNEENDKNNRELDQVGEYLLRSQSKIISSNQDSHQNLEGNTELMSEGNLEREWISQLCIEKSMTFEPTMDWKNSTTEKDRINEYLDDCIIDEFSRLLK
jgi:hypothetical protein